jgi:hypothetical protein
MVGPKFERSKSRIKREFPCAKLEAPEFLAVVRTARRGQACGAVVVFSRPREVVVARVKEMVPLKILKIKDSGAARPTRALASPRRRRPATSNLLNANTDANLQVSGVALEWRKARRCLIFFLHEAVRSFLNRKSTAEWLRRWYNEHGRTT